MLRLKLKNKELHSSRFFLQEKSDVTSQEPVTERLCPSRPLCVSPPFACADLSPGRGSRSSGALRGLPLLLSPTANPARYRLKRAVMRPRWTPVFAQSQRLSTALLSRAGKFLLFGGSRASADKRAGGFCSVPVGRRLSFLKTWLFTVISTPVLSARRLSESWRP